MNPVTSFFSYHWVEHIDNMIVRQGDGTHFFNVSRANLTEIKKHVREYIRKPEASIMILNLREISRQEYENMQKYSM